MGVTVRADTAPQATALAWDRLVAVRDQARQTRADESQVACGAAGNVLSTDAPAADQAFAWRRPWPHGPRREWPEGFVAALRAAAVGETFNQYADSELRCRRLVAYLASRRAAPFLLVGEAAGYRGARVSGIPFTSERQLTGTGPAEASATIVHRVLAELGIEERILLWNLVPTHPGTATSNRAPTSPEIEGGRPFLAELAAGRRILPVGRLSERALGLPGVRHPSHGGAAAFRAGLVEWLGSDHR